MPFGFDPVDDSSQREKEKKEKERIEKQERSKKKQEEEKKKVSELQKNGREEDTKVVTPQHLERVLVKDDSEGGVLYFKKLGRGVLVEMLSYLPNFVDVHRLSRTCSFFNECHLFFF